MHLYLLQQKRDGTPVGVFSDTEDFFRPADEHLRAAGRQIVLSKLPSTSWADFVEILADKTPTPDMQWDSYESVSTVLEVVLSDALRDLESTKVS